MCICEYNATCVAISSPQNQKNGIRFSRAGFAESCELLQVELGSSTDALEEEEIFLTAEPSVQFPPGEWIFFPCHAIVGS